MPSLAFSPDDPLSDADPLSPDLLARLAALLRAGEPVEVTLRRGNVSLRLTVGRDEDPPSAPPDSPLTDCEADIITILAAAGKRLVTDKVLKALQDAGKLHGDSTVIKALAELVQRKKLLSNQWDKRGRGYGLPEWS